MSHKLQYLRFFGSEFPILVSNIRWNFIVFEKFRKHSDVAATPAF